MKPGHQVKATIYVEQKEDVIAIPNQALFYENDQAAVYVKSGSRYKKRTVKIGTRSLTQTIVESGLDEGDVVALGKPAAEDQAQ
jgi:HlyD family secretion protein